MTQALCHPLGHFVMSCLLKKSLIKKIYIAMCFTLKELNFFSFFTGIFYV